MFKKLPGLAKNFYVVIGVLFFVWMLFFDQNDFISQYRMSRKLGDLENEYSYYGEKMPEVLNETQALKNNSAQLEKFAREKYLMKKKSEDVYIIVEEEK
jgi:cell division protein DivIC